MGKVGRNQPCPCGSGKKYKHCCGAITTPNSPPFTLPPGAENEIRLRLQRHEAREHQRRLMQGLGRPIISFESHGYRLVGVGNRIYWSQQWRTFHDFLTYYIKQLLTPEWANVELARPQAQRHPLFSWLDTIDAYLREHPEHRSAGTQGLPAIGAMRAFFALAYDLYLCAHNAELPDLLLKRLRNAQNFEGAVYEAFVIGSFAKAGFEVAFENETDSTRSHCEFTATHKQTKRKFSVEAKAYSSSSRRAGASSDPPQVRGKLIDALKKQADHQRIIFIELSRLPLGVGEGEREWATAIATELEQAERELVIDGHSASPAFLFVTNRPFVHALGSTNCRETYLTTGFKFDDFPPFRIRRTLLDGVRARDRHIEMHWLMKALNTHVQIPSTFDDRTPEEAFTAEPYSPLRVGDTHMVTNEKGESVRGILENAIVMENARAACGVYRREDGVYSIHQIPLTDSDLAIYHSSPETFFGVKQRHPSRSIESPLDLYDFFFESYSQSTREKLLEFLAGAPDFEQLKQLSRTQLAEEYPARMATTAWSQSHPTAGQTGDQVYEF